MTSFTVDQGAIYFGDAVALLKSLPADCIDMVFTDPPYRVISGGNSSPASTANYGWKSSVLASNDGKIFKHNDVKIADYIGELYRVLKPGTHCYIMTNNLNLRTLLNEANRVGFGFHNLLMWKKNNVNANRWNMKHVELVVMLYKGPAKPINDCGSKQVFECDNIPGKLRLHDTEKPVDLVRHYVENSSQPDEIVLDPFSGSGSTAAACIASGRRFMTMELDEIYYWRSVFRIAALCR